MWQLAVDVAGAFGAYFAAAALRFSWASEAAFPHAGPGAPWVIGMQLIALITLRTYRPTGTGVAVTRAVIASGLGTVVGGLLVGGLYGRAEVSAWALSADFVFLSAGATLWRGIYTINGIFARGRDAAGAVPPGMEVTGGVRPLKGVARDLWRYRGLVMSLVSRDLKLKYRGSVLGFLWSMLNPLVMVAVYTFAFTVILHNRTPGFVPHLLLGLLTWTFFASSATMSNLAIIEAGGLIKSVYFPRLILPLASVLFNLSQYLLTLVVFLPIVFLYYGVRPAAPMLAFPLLLALLVLFTVGVAFSLSALTALYSDIRHLTEIALSLLFWLTPIVYSINTVREATGAAGRSPILLSPMASFVVAAQQMFYDSVWPDGSVWLIATVYALATFGVGAALFLSLEDRFGEQV
jgi:ABC-2 type transport system permease protein